MRRGWRFDFDLDALVGRLGTEVAAHDRMMALLGDAVRRLTTHPSARVRRASLDLWTATSFGPGSGPTTRRHSIYATPGIDRLYYGKTTRGTDPFRTAFLPEPSYGGHQVEVHPLLEGGVPVIAITRGECSSVALDELFYEKAAALCAETAARQLLLRKADAPPILPGPNPYLDRLASLRRNG